MKKLILLSMILAFIAACTTCPARPTPISEITTMPEPTSTLAQPTVTLPPTATSPPTFTPEPTNTPLPTPPAHCRHSILEPTEIIHAVHMTGNWGTNRVHASENSLPAEYFEYLRDMNVNWAGISVALHYEDSMDSTVGRVYSGVITPTFTDEFLRRLIQAFHQHGICVYLTLAFEANEAEESEHPLYRIQLGEPTPIFNDGRIQSEFWPWALDHPEHERFVAEFWESYTEQAVHFGQLAEEEGVALYSLGTETEGLFRTRPSDEWPNDFRDELRAMVAAVREVYSGPLTYDMWNIVFTEPQLGFGPGSEHMWEDSELDVIGLSAYFELTDYPPTRVLSIEELEASWEAIFQEYLIPLQAANPDRPIYFTEFGYVDSIRAPYDQEGEGACRYYSDADNNGLDDGEEAQANIYQALFKAMDRHPGVVNGVFIWDMWMATEDRWALEGSQIRGFSVRDKLAEDVLRATYGGAPRATQGRLYFDIPAPFEVEEALVIYNDALGDGWEIWPWQAEVDPAAESVVHGGLRALGVTMPGPGGNLGFFNPLDISEYAYLEFYVNGGAQGGQELSITFQDVKNEVNIATIGLCTVTSSSPLPPDEWVLIRFPIHYQDLRGKQISIHINNNSDQPAPQFFLDDMRLVREGPP